ncbi:MAG TPA: hypothetical protein VHB48_04300 [Chitinophagaceae bacterium]|nr:hypothetical protein [Chitinophagaceae bacterium]
MFDPEEIPSLRKSIQDCAESDRKLLDDLLEEVKIIKSIVKAIKPRTTTSISLVASDGGNNKLVYDPFYFQIIRVVDSNGSKLCLDIVSPTTDTDELSKRQFNLDGTPNTKLGKLMKDLGCKTLNDVSSMIPSGLKARTNPDQVSPSWVLTYRDLCEWAVLYDKICYTRFSTNTLIVRDGLLRSKLFSKDLFVVMMNKIIEAIDKAYNEDKVKIFIVGLAKHSQVLSRYALSMHIEDVFPKGEPRFAKIDKTLEEKSYAWKEFIRKDQRDIAEGEEKNKFSVGDMYLVRFGKMSGDPLWAVDLLYTQTSNDAEVFGYLLADAIDGFPVPFYPMCLQKAHEHAQIVDFDMDILQDSIIEAIRELLPQGKKTIIDEQVFNSDKSQNRYS